MEIQWVYIMLMHSKCLSQQNSYDHRRAMNIVKWEDSEISIRYILAATLLIK